MLTKESILEYQQIYKKEFNEEISFELAAEKATSFLKLLKILYKPTIKKILEANKK